MSGLDLIIRNARFQEEGRMRQADLAIAAGRIVAIGKMADADAQTLDAGGRLIVPGLIETHIHLDKTCIMERCRAEEGTVAEAVRETAKAKRQFTADDIYARGKRTMERCICHGTMRMRSHVEVDPGIGLLGFEAISALGRDYAWALDLEICVFPQEGLLNNPGTEALLREGLRRGARAIGAVPYLDSDPRGQIDLIFRIARDFDVDIDMHLDLGETPEGMQIEYVCRKTEEFGYGGRVAVGHATQLSIVERPRYEDIARKLADAGVAVAILPSTDLYLMGRSHDHAVPRGVVPGGYLMGQGVNCTISTNNVMNPFTPYGDGSLIRMANLYANICHVARPQDLAECLAMITERSARLMRIDDYGIRLGAPADLVLLDASEPAGAIAELAQPLWGLKKGRRSFANARPELYPPEAGNSTAGDS